MFSADNNKVFFVTGGPNVGFGADGRQLVTADQGDRSGMASTESLNFPWKLS